MAGVAPRFIEPGIGVLSDLAQGPVAVDTGHSFLKHGIPQTLGLRAGVTLITAVYRVGDFAAVS